MMDEHSLSLQTILNPFPNNNFKTPKLKDFTDDNSRFDENGEKFSKWLENAAEKGEIARYEQFLLFPQRFQKTCTADRKNNGLFEKGLMIYQQKTESDRWIKLLTLNPFQNKP